jgi:hypothetical protein
MDEIEVDSNKLGFVGGELQEILRIAERSTPAPL